MNHFARQGSKMPNAKMTEAKVKTARRLHAKGVPIKDIAEEFGVHITTMSMIVRRKRWRHVP